MNPAGTDGQEAGAGAQRVGLVVAAGQTGFRPVDDVPALAEAVEPGEGSRAGDLPFLASDSSGDLEVVGPSKDYRAQVLKGGDLGGDDTFRSVVPEADRAGSVIYVDIDAFEPALKKLASGSDANDLANLLPLRAVGLSGWVDNGVARVSFKISTN